MRQLKITSQITNRESKSLDKYFQDITKIPMITADEEVELAQQIRDGSHTALNKLVNANLRFVVSVAKQYQNQGMKLSDLINEGNIGLVKAAKRFDETRGFKFISYAVWWIRQSILQALANNSRMVRLPLNKINSISKINKAYSFLEQSKQRPPSEEEIAKELDMTTRDVKLSLKNSRRHVSTDAPLKEGETSTLYSVLDHGDSPRPDSSLMQDSLKTDVNRALNKLDDKEASIVRLYFGIATPQPMSLSEIGETVNLTRERVRQIKERAVKRLRHSSRSEPLKQYLG
ncbi:RNA polymerase sigma factor RpoD/SigA [Sungkyunkwania multivorans]|uniref:RNA polymerase sigma factor RpoD/SigA n=1 Tax=Sungkyunkwania multivorans TaxID=1173618 RepID=A0ABW3CZC2_9FLAO